jgi:hypothetical protein
MSSAVTKGKIVMSPLSTGEKGVITSRPVTSRKILAHSHQCMKHQGHGLNTHPALQLLQGGGCMALAPHLGMVVWPCKFLPHLTEKYDGTVNPAEFL